MPYKPRLDWDKPERCIECGGAGTIHAPAQGRRIPCPSRCAAAKPFLSDMADWPGGVGELPAD